MNVQGPKFKRPLERARQKTDDFPSNQQQDVALRFGRVQNADESSSLLGLRLPVLGRMGTR